MSTGQFPLDVAGCLGVSTVVTECLGARNFGALYTGLNPKRTVVV